MFECLKDPAYFNDVDVWSFLGYTCRATGNHYLSAACYKQAFYCASSIPNQIATLINLANSYETLDNIKIAKELLEKILIMQLEYYHGATSHIADILHNLSVIHARLGNIAEEKTCLEEAHAIQIEIYGSDHIEIANTLNNLACVYRQLGDSNEEKKLLEEALAITIKHYGNEHIEMANILSNLALVSWKLGNSTKAQTLLEKVIDIQTKHYNTICNLDIAYSMANLALIYISEHNYLKGLNLIDTAYATYIEILGIKHPESEKIAQVTAEIISINPLAWLTFLLEKQKITLNPDPKTTTFCTALIYCKRIADPRYIINGN